MADEENFDLYGDDNFINGDDGDMVRSLFFFSFFYFYFYFYFYFLFLFFIFTLISCIPYI